MRFRKIDRYLLLLAGLFVLAVLRRSDLPGEEVLPDLYRASVHGPLLAKAAAAINEDEVDLVVLRSELAAARREIRQLRSQIEANRRLSEYFGTLEWEATPQALGGWVVLVDPNPFRQRFRIDRGTSHGVRAGMPVVTGHALLGVVSQPYRRVSDVARVDDPGFRLEVEISTGEGTVPGVVSGNGDEGLEVRLIRTADGLAAGNEVFTTRYHKMIPPGLLVGRVDRVRDLDQDGIPEITVTPAAALGRWAQIEVLAARR